MSVGHREKRRIQLLQDATGLGYVKAKELWESIKGEDVSPLGGGHSLDNIFIHTSIFISYDSGDGVDNNRIALSSPPVLEECWDGQWSNLLKRAEFSLWEKTLEGEKDNQLSLGKYGPLRPRELEHLLHDRVQILERWMGIKTLVYPVLCNSQEDVDSVFSVPWEAYLSLGICPVLVASGKDSLTFPKDAVRFKLGMAGITLESGPFSMSIEVDHYQGGRMPDKCKWESYPSDLPLTVFALGENEDGPVTINLIKTPMIALSGNRVGREPFIARALLQGALEKNHWRPEILSMEESDYADAYYSLDGVPKVRGIHDVHARLRELSGELERRYYFLDSNGKNNIYDYWETGVPVEFAPIIACINRMDAVFREKEAGATFLYREAQLIINNILRRGRAVGIHLMVTVDLAPGDRIYDSWNTIPGDRLYGESLANIGARIAEVFPSYEEYRVYKDPQIIMLQEYGTVRYLRPYLT